MIGAVLQNIRNLKQLSFVTYQNQYKDQATNREVNTLK